jgi:diguanylate cyclase (GGDEF)-like protein
MSIGKFTEIAVVLAGIDEEYQNSILEGIIDCAKQNNVNISCFSAFGGVMTSSHYDVGEYNIYELINFERFDGIILLTNTINDPNEKEKITAKAKASKLPTVVVGCDDYPEFYSVNTDNFTAMKQMTEHLITEHGAKTFYYISGPLANPEAVDRLDAFRSALDDAGLAIDENRIYYGEFRAIDGIKATEEFLSSGMPLPDAIVCANDTMALSVIMTLEKNGYEVPKDVLVTGFDNTYSARHFYPAVTSVSRSLSKTGFTCCEIILKLADGKRVKKNTFIKTVPVFTESCGCKQAAINDLPNYKKSTLKLIENCKTDISTLNRITSKLADTETADASIAIISDFIGELGCERFCICLCSEWDGIYFDKYSSAKVDNYQIHGYTKRMSAPLIWNKGKVSSVNSFNSEDMYPQPFMTGGNVSFFLPLHFRERCLGYYIISNGDFPIKSFLCHSLMMNISNSFENIRKLIHLNSMIDELDKLYVIDPLCGIYNRNGFIRTADLIFRQCETEGKNILVSFIDMDGLKYINDNFGHKEGDFALQQLASVIDECCKGSRICARFGGDEFIILGENATEDDIATLELTFKSHLESMNHVINKPYEITASIGTIVSKVENGSKLFALITQADQLMYDRKKKNKTSKYLRRK